MATAVAILLATAACSGDGVRPGEASVTVERGSRVLIAERGDPLRLFEGRRTLHLGAQVKVLSGGATLALDDGSRVEVRRGSEIELGSPLRLVRNDVLVTTGSQPLKVAAAGSEVVVNGVSRLSRDLAVSARAYRGSATLTSAARSLEVRALREATIPSLGVLPASAQPLDYDPRDAWDRRFLGTAMELGNELEAKANGFTRSLGPGEGSTPGFYRLLLPDLEEQSDFGEELLTTDRIARPGETLVGATIALNSKDQSSFNTRWSNVFAFRDEGAAWGLVALDQQVDDIGGVVRRVDAAIGRQPFAFAPPPPNAPAPAVTAPPAPAAPQPVVAPAPAPAPAAPAPRPAPARAPSTPAVTLPTPGSPTLTPITLPPLLTQPEPAPQEGLLAPLVETVTNTLGGLLSGGQ